MRVLCLLLLSCNPPPPLDLGEAPSLPVTTLENHLGSRVTISGTPTPTAVVEYPKRSSTCRLFYLLGNRNLFVEDCASSSPPFTGTLKPFLSLPNYKQIQTYYSSHFSITINPASTFVLSTDS